MTCKWIMEANPGCPAELLAAFMTIGNPDIRYALHVNIGDMAALSRLRQLIWLGRVDLFRLTAV